MVNVDGLEDEVKKLNTMPLHLGAFVLSKSKWILNKFIQTNNASCITFGFNPSKSLIMSSGVKAIWLPLINDEFSTEAPKLEKFGLLVNG